MARPISKNRASQILSKYIREISDEKSEIREDPLTHEKTICTKAEALARVVWGMALGWTEEEDVLQNGIKVATRIRRYPPAQWAIALVYDRAEGKAAQTGDTGDKQADVSDKITDRTKNRLNALAEAEDAECRDNTAPVIDTIPIHPARLARSNNGNKDSKSRPQPPPRMEAANVKSGSE